MVPVEIDLAKKIGFSQNGKFRFESLLREVHI